jgi:hypothetical protein
MSRGKRWGTVLVAAALLPAAICSGQAFGSRVVTIGSHVSIRSSELRFSGRVTSPNHACAERRRVVLFKVVQGGPDEAMARTTTGSDGTWSLRLSGFAGVSLARFYARAARRSEGAAGTIYVCAAARSKAIGPAS